MKGFLKTTRFGKGRAAHHHIVFVDDETGVGVCSESAGHIHEIYFEPPTPPQTDPETGEPLDEGSEGGFMLLPDMTDEEGGGHTHDLLPYETSEKPSTEIDRDIINSVLTQYKAWKEWEADSIEEGLECEDFYTGEKQWTEAQRQQLQAQDRACLTLNYTGKMVDELCGYEKEQSQDFTYSPVEGGDQRAADMYNIVATKIKEACFYERERSDAFEDAVVVGRGLGNIYISYDNDLEGEIKIERFPWSDVVFAPHEKIDLSDCEGLVKHKWFSKAKFRQFWPDKEKEMEEAFEFFETADQNSIHEDTTKDPYDQGHEMPRMLGPNDPTVDVRRREIKVYERQLKTYEKAKVAVSPGNDFVFNTFGWKAGDIRQIETIGDFRLVEKTVVRIRVTRCTANSLLSDENPAELPVDDLFIVPLYCKKRKGRFWGKVKDAIDPQKEINHRHSQAVDIGNKMAAYGWFYDSTTFANDFQKRKFIQNSSTPGFTAEVQDVGRPPVKVEGVKFPAEIVELLRLGQETLSTLMNVTVEPGGANESGSALLQKQRLRIIGNEYLFDNERYFQMKVGRLLLSLIRYLYTPERIYRIVSTQAAKEEVELGGQPFEEFSEEEIISILDNVDIAKYDVVVTETESSPTVRLATFSILSELVQSGMPIPPAPLINLLPIPQSARDEILQAMAEEADAAAQEAAATKEMEENKTLLAQGIMPPSVQQRLSQEQAASQQPGGDSGQMAQGNSDPLAGF